MKIRERVLEWLGITELLRGRLADAETLNSVEHVLNELEVKVDALLIQPVATTPPRVSMSVLDWEGVTIQAMNDLQKEPEKQN